MASHAPSDGLVTVRVNRLLPFGLLVNLKDGRIGVIRERELAWDTETRRRWRDRFRSGDVFQAIILGKGHAQRLELSLRLAQNDPWADLADRYRVGQLVTGVVTGVQPYGAFVEIEPGVTGLLHRSRLPVWAKATPLELFWPGDHVKVTIEEIDIVERRLGLGLKRALEQRWKHAIPDLKGRPGTNSNTVARFPLELFTKKKKVWSILVVEDDAVQGQAIAQWLIHAGQHAVTTTCAEDGLALLQHERPDLVLMDLGLPGMNGILVLQQIRTQWPTIRSVLMTDWARADEHLTELEELRASGVYLLIKPLLPEDLLNVLLDQADSDESAPVESSSAVEQPSTMQFSLAKKDEVASLKEPLIRLRRFTHAAKVVLFALDPAQRKVSVVAESGREPLRKEALVDLIHSPVRDVAEDGLAVQTDDVNRAAAARFRYLVPLLPFAACLGVPIPAGSTQKYALFLFHPQPDTFDAVHEQHALATAIALGALLERQQFEAHMIQMQRLALLGHLTRALVHEINHRLSPINFTLDHLESRCATIERLAEQSPGEVEGEVRHARDTLRDLAQAARSLTATARLFGRITSLEQEQILRLDNVAEEVATLVRDTADRARVTIEVLPPPKLVFTRAQATQVQQVLLNIVINAIQQIALLRPGEAGRVEVRLNHGQRNQQTLRIDLEDDGPGIHQQLLERIFELGFTTRQEEGSGLGLYITRSLVEALGGRAYVTESHILWGTTFAVELPFSI